MNRIAFIFVLSLTVLKVSMFRLARSGARERQREGERVGRERRQVRSRGEREEREVRLGGGGGGRGGGRKNTQGHVADDLLCYNQVSLQQLFHVQRHYADKSQSLSPWPGLYNERRVLAGVAEHQQTAAFQGKMQLPHEEFMPDLSAIARTHGVRHHCTVEGRSLRLL